MTNELMVRQSMALTFDEMTRAAKAMALSGYFNDAKDVSQAMVKVMAGAELGIGPFASMTGISVIKGKPVLGANLIATLIKQDPRYDYRVVRLDDNGCVLAFYEHGEMVGEASFTADDARKAGLSGDNWKKYPRNMYFARAISNGAKWYAPGIFGGSPVYTADEMGAEVDEEGDPIIDVTPPARVAIEETGEIVEGTTAEWHEIEPAMPDYNQPLPERITRELAEAKAEAKVRDSRGAGSPAAQAKRAAQRPSASNGVDVDWEAKALDAKNLGQFAAAVAMLLPEYGHANHVKNALPNAGADWSPENSAETIRWLRERKAETA